MGSSVVDGHEAFLAKSIGTLDDKRCLGLFTASRLPMIEGPDMVLSRIDSMSLPVWTLLRIHSSTIHVLALDGNGMSRYICMIAYYYH